mgnify:CR=1 FL=1
MNGETKIPKMMTVRQVAKTGMISEYALRQLIKQGKIPCIALEHKVLINFDAFVEQLVNRIVRVCRVAQPLQQRAVGDNGAGNSRHVAKAVVDSFLGLGDAADDLLAELLLDIGLVLNPDPAKHEEQGQDEAQQKRQIRSK